MGTRGVSAAEVGMAKKKNQAARGGRAKPKTTTNSKKSNAGAPSGNGRASQAIGVVFMALGVLAGYLMWAKGGVESRTNPFTSHERNNRAARGTGDGYYVRGT